MNINTCYNLLTHFHSAVSLSNTHTRASKQASVTLAGFAVVHQSVSSVTGALDQSSHHLTLLGAASIILVTVALVGAWPCAQHRNITGT